MGEDTRGEMVIRREEAKLERHRAKTKAHEENMTKTLAAYFKDAGVKRVLAEDAMRATNERGGRDAIFDKANAGIYDDDQEVITGSEPRPWEE